MKTFVAFIALWALTSCEKPLFDQQFDPNTARVNELVTLNPKVSGDSYSWMVENLSYYPEESPVLFSTHDVKNPTVLWNYPGTYQVYLSVKKNGKTKNYSGSVVVTW